MYVVITAVVCTRALQMSTCEVGNYKKQTTHQNVVHARTYLKNGAEIVATV